MKMNFFFGYPFWGLLLILWGVSLVLKSFNIHLPLGRIFLGIVVIMFGIKILVSNGKIRVKSKITTQGGSYYKAGSSEDYNLIFSSGTIDLRELHEDSEDIEISVVFASATVILPDHIPINIEPTTVFGMTSTRNVKSISKEGVRPIKIESSCVFGSLEYITESVEHNAHEDEIEEGDSTEASGEF